MLYCAKNSKRILYHTVSHIDHITRFAQHRNAASQRGGGEGLWLQSQGGQDLCADADAEHLIFKTSTEEQTVDLTNKGMTKDSQRFSRWFHSVWRTGCCGVVKGSGQPGVESECVVSTYFRRLVHKDSCFEHGTSPGCASECVKMQFHVHREEPETTILVVASCVFDVYALKVMRAITNACKGIVVG